MANPSKISTLNLLLQQLLRSEQEVIAFRHKQPLTVADLKTKVFEICHALKYDNNQLWALSMHDSFNFVAGLLALFYSGKQPLLLNPSHQEMRQYYTALLTDNELNSSQFIDKKIININQLPLANFCNEKQQLTYDFKQQTLTLFTSGSTGLPKPIEKTVYQLQHEIEILNKDWGKTIYDLVIASVSHEHMYGLTFKIMLSLCCKIPFVCEPVLYQEHLATFKHKRIIYITTPSIIKTLDNHLPVINCDKVISSAGKLSYQESQFCFENLGVLPNEIYGSSETGIIATRQQTQPNTPWTLFSSMRIEYDQSLQQAILYTPLLDQPEVLNDKIKIVSNQHFHLSGRKDKIIKISENRVSLTHIENKINQLNEVEQVIIIPLEQNNRTILGAVIQLTPSHKKLLQTYSHLKLTQYFRLLLKDTLSLIEMPKRWRFVEFLPKNSQGKSSYIELKALFNALKKNNE